MELIQSDNKKLCLIFGLNDITNNISFFSENEDFIQVGAWQYNKDKKLLPHNHNKLLRTVNKTQEFLYISSGSIKAYIYDDSDKLIKTFVLKVNEGLILFSGGHGFDVLEDNTKVIEVKNGPYLGAVEDRRRLDL